MEHLHLTALGIIHNSHLNQATVDQLNQRSNIEQTVSSPNFIHAIQKWVIRENVFIFFLLSLSLPHKSFMTNSPSLELV